MIKLLIVEDFPILTKGLISIFETIPDFEIIGLADNTKNCIEILKNAQPDIIIIDLKSCGSLCLKFINDIREIKPTLNILLLTSANDPIYINKLLTKGINVCLLKNTCPSVIIEAIRSISNGNKYISEEFKDKKLNGSTFLNCISRREIEILRMIAEGMTNKEIAENLSISPLTVDSHRKNLIIKLGAKNTASLIKIAMEQGHL
jgi:DNA-binding NarL/FixJ family response regulator